MTFVTFVLFNDGVEAMLRRSGFRPEILHPRAPKSLAKRGELRY